MATTNPRVPLTCPPGFLGRYTVRRGDTMFQIAQFFRVNLSTLIANNRHIPDPNFIFPGDVLCVPSQVAIPCALVLREEVPGDLPFGTTGVALVHFDRQGTQAITVAARLPSPSTFGNFDAYLTTAFIPNVGGFGDQLFPTPEDPPTWAATIDFPTVAQLTQNSFVVVRPLNTTTGAEGPNLLIGRLSNCNICP